MRRVIPAEAPGGQGNKQCDHAAPPAKLMTRILASLALPAVLILAASPVAAQASATVRTVATAMAALGQPIQDVATVSGVMAGPAPTGTVTFLVFGPDDAVCSGPPIFVSANRPLGGGPPPTATSEPFTPVAPGSYRWVAQYSGDANYKPVVTACGDPSEISLVSSYPLAVPAAQPGAAAPGGVPVAGVASNRRPDFPVTAAGAVAIAVLAQVLWARAIRQRGGVR